MTSSNEEQKAAALAEFNGTSEFEKEFRQQLKAKGPFDQDVWALQKRVRDKLAHIFFLDHDLAVRKDLEGVVWHLVHYRVIEEFRRNLKTVSNQANSKRDARGNIPAEKRRELRLLTSSFRAFLTEATGFYLAFINKLTSHYSLERVERLVLKRLEVEVPEWTDVHRKYPDETTRQATLSCHRSLIRLGDLARYREIHSERRDKNWALPRTFYNLAHVLVPDNGNPFNQLAVIVSYQGNELNAVEHYLRSLVVKQPFPAALDNLVLLFHKIKSIVGDVNDEKGDKEEGNPSSERDPAIGLVTKFVAMHAHVFVPEQQNSNAFMRMKDSFLPTFRALLSMRELQADVVTKFFVISSGSLYFASKDLWSKITQQQKFQSDRSGNRSKSSAAASAAASENTNKMSYAAVSKKQMVDKERFAMMIEMVQVLFDEVMKNMETAAASTTKLSKKKASRNDREPLLHHYIKPIKFVLLWLLRQLEAKSQDSVVEDGAEPAESSSTAGDFDFATFPWNLCARILTSIAARSPMSELLAEIRRSDLAIAHDHDVNSTFKSIWGVSPLMVADDVEFLGFGPLLSPVDEVAEYPLDVLTGAMMATVNSNDENSDAREIELIHMKQVVDIGFKLTKLKTPWLYLHFQRSAEMRDFVRWTFTTTPPPPTPSPPKTAVSSPMSATRQPMQSATTSSQTLFQSPKKPTYRMDISPEKKPDEPKTGAMDGVTNVDDYGYDVEEEDDHEVIVFTGRQQQQQQQQQPQEHELGEDPVPKDGVPGGFTGMSFSSSAYEADSGRNGFGAMLSFSSTAEAMSGVVGASGSSFSPSSSNDGLNLLSKPAAIGSERRTSSSSISLNAGEGDENGTTDGVIAGNAALVTTEDAVVPKLAKQPSSSPIGPNSGDAKSTLANGLLGSGMGTLFGGTTVFSDIIARNQGNGSPTTSQTDVAGGGSPESLALQKSSSVPPGFVMQPSSSSSSVSSASIFAFPPGNENELRSDTITSASGVAKSKLTPPRDKPMPVPNSASSDRTMNVDAVNTISFLGLGSPPSGFKKAGSGKARGPASISGELKREEQRQESMSTLLTMGNAAPWMAVQPSFGMSSPNYTTVTPQGSIAYTGGMASSAMAYDNSNRIDGTDTAPRPFVIGLHQLPQQSWNSQQPFATVPAHQHPPGLSGMSSPVATSPLPGSIAVGTGLGGASWGSAVAKGSPLLSAEANKNFATYMASYGQNAPQYPVAQASTAMGWMSPASVGGLTGMSAVANGYGGDMRTNTAAVANTSWYGSAVAAAASAGVAATGGYPSFAPATHQMGGVYGYPNNTSQTGMMYPAVAGGSVPMGGGGSASAIGMSPLNFQQYQHVMPGMAPPPQQTMLQQQQSQRVGVNSGLQTDQNAYR